MTIASLRSSRFRIYLSIYFCKFALNHYKSIPLMFEFYVQVYFSITCEDLFLLLKFMLQAEYRMKTIGWIIYVNVPKGF